MELKYGWVCPLCGKALSPDTKACTCYKEKNDIINTIKPLGPLEIQNPDKIYKWVKDWATPYEEKPVFKFYTSGSSDPCEGCSNKGAPFCHCTLGGSKVSY